MKIVLERVAKEIEQDLAQASWISDDAIGRLIGVSRTQSDRKTESSGDPTEVSRSRISSTLFWAAVVPQLSMTPAFKACVSKALFLSPRFRLFSLFFPRQFARVEKQKPHQQLMQGERLLGQLDLVLLHAGEIQDVVDYDRQVLACRWQVRQISLLRRNQYEK